MRLLEGQTVESKWHSVPFLISIQVSRNRPLGLSIFMGSAPVLHDKVGAAQNLSLTVPLI